VKTMIKLRWARLDIPENNNWGNLKDYFLLRNKKAKKPNKVKKDQMMRIYRKIVKSKYERQKDG